jgi:pimeloyl-ACP methyl ester carboxylesterase
MAARRNGGRTTHEAVPLPIWQELLVGVEMVYLRISPVYWGYGIPRGDGSAVVVIPGFLATDLYLAEFRAWLRRIGYQPYYSGIGLNAECPNLLIRHRLNETIAKAYKATRRKVHLIGHSLGGTIALAFGAQNPDRVASVITMGAPFRGLSVHPTVLRATELVRRQILERHGDGVLPTCYTGACTCSFLASLSTELPKTVAHTAIYTKTDGIVDWQVCLTGDPSIDVEVSSTHIGLVFNPIVYELVAQRLHEKSVPARKPSPRRKRRVS